MKRQTLLLAALAALVALVAGCRPPYLIVRQAMPNPFLRAQNFSVEPIHFEGMLVGNETEESWMARKTPEQQASYQQDRQAMVDGFVERVASRSPSMNIIAGPPPTPDTFIVRPHMVFLEPGFFAYFVNRATRVRMNVQLLSQQGQVLDEFIVEDAVAANIYNPSTGGRMRTAAVHLANYVARYLRDRTGAQ